MMTDFPEDEKRNFKKKSEMINSKPPILNIFSSKFQGLFLG
jgi:hypothetical protein